MKHIVVFDGTSAYVIDASDLAEEKKLNNVSELFRTNDLDKANSYCDVENEKICGC